MRPDSSAVHAQAGPQPEPAAGPHSAPTVESDADPNPDVGVDAAARSRPGRRPRPARGRSRGHLAQLDVLAVIAVGGVLGAEARYGVARLLPHPPSAFPWATLVVNALGCLLIGGLMVVVTEVTRPHRLARPFLGVGVLGGFTTFSTYTVDVQRLLLAHRPGVALGYLLGTLAAALVAVWLGATSTRAAVVLVGRRVGRRAGRRAGAAAHESPSS
jgi:fluoride exporter